MNHGGVVTPFPAGTTLVADPSLRRRDGGQLLIGGSPLRFVRLSRQGADVVSAWMRGEPIGDAFGANRLARRLTGGGMLHPVPSAAGADGSSAASASGADVTIVIPVKDDASGLATTLAHLPPGIPTIVVDDGSSPPVDNAGLPGDVTLIRRSVAGGPGVARQQALASVVSELVVFVDAGVTLPVDAVDRLVAWFADEQLVAVAPRIASSERDDRLARYERRHSPLDLGPVPARVAVGSPVAYLPTACLACRTAAVDASGGFDPTLRWGEDVDLVWRLVGAGGDVRYDPSIVAEHPPRPDLAAFARQRLGYGSAAGPLGDRHGERVAPLRMSGWSAAICALAFGGRPLIAAGVAAATAVALARKLAPTLPDPGVESALLAARGHAFAGRSTARAATRDYWPLTMALGASGLRGAALRLAFVSLATRIGDERNDSEQLLTDVALGVVDDLAYGLGVWKGAIASRSPRALLPHIEAWPPRT